MSHRSRNFFRQACRSSKSSSAGCRPPRSRSIERNTLSKYTGSDARIQGLVRAAKDSNISWSGIVYLIWTGCPPLHSIFIDGFMYLSMLWFWTIECASTRRARTTKRHRISFASAASLGIWHFPSDSDCFGFLPFLLPCAKKLLIGSRIIDADHDKVQIERLF